MVPSACMLALMDSIMITSSAVLAPSIAKLATMTKPARLVTHRPRVNTNTSITPGASLNAPTRSTVTLHSNAKNAIQIARIATRPQPIAPRASKTATFHSFQRVNV